MLTSSLGKKDNNETSAVAVSFDTAVHHAQAGRHAEALACCREALTHEPDNARALHLMGTLSLQASRHDEAVDWISQAVRRDPQPNYLVSLGKALLPLGRSDEAIKCFDKAIQIKPDDAELWMSLGDALLATSKLDLALLTFGRALELNPHHFNACYKSGVLLCHLAKYEDALDRFNLCYGMQQENAPTLRERARTLQALKRFEEALADNKKADALQPNNADTCNNIGACLQALGREQEALQWFERANAIQPNTVEILNNMAFLLGLLQRFDEAFSLYDSMKAPGLNNATTDWNRSHIELLTGNFEAGWISREARWTKPNPTPYPSFDRPMWLGKEPVEGKTILVHVDEGLGDTIQFVRYVPMLAARGARIILVVEPGAQRLLCNLPGVAECLSYPAVPLPAFDMHCPIGSLPLAFGTRLDTIPAATAYLPAASKERVATWESLLGPRARLRIGLAWSGNPDHPNDRNRSMPLHAMSRLLDFDATFVSLQKDPRSSDKAYLKQTNILDPTEYFHDLSDTAALIDCLDLVITVDTSVAHLAAALGRPTWILLPHTPDYRWLLNRDDSPWYPTARLFRQTPACNYSTVMETVRQELAAFATIVRTEAASALSV